MEGLQEQLSTLAVSNNAHPTLQTAMMCCAHHSCMMSPVSPVQLPSRPYLSNTSSTACYSPANASPFMTYGSALPIQQPSYVGPAVFHRVTAAAAAAAAAAAVRLQRWNSVDSSMHLHHHVGWGNSEASWTQAYGSIETGLHYAARQACAPTAFNPARSFQYNGNMMSPMCRSSFELWSQQHHQCHCYLDQPETAYLTSSNPILNDSQAADNSTHQSYNK